MRGYTVVASAVALNVDYKWLDNLLSHHLVDGVRQARQGVARTLPFKAILVIAIAMEFIDALQMPLGHALTWADRMVKGENPAKRGNVTLAANLAALESWLLSRLAYAVEVAPVPRRGRPPRLG